MKLLINCSNLRIGGGLQVAHSFIHELINFQQNEYHIILSSEMSKQIDDSLFSSNFIFYNYNIVPSVMNALKGNNKFLDRIVIKSKIEVVFTIFGPSYWKPKVRHVCGYAKPHYIYEESPFFKKISLKERIILAIKKKIHLYDFSHNSDVLITENPNVSDKLRRLIRKQIFTVSNNYNQIFDNPSEWDRSITLPKFDGLYLLTISANYAHKNLSIIPLVVKELSKVKDFNFKFVLTLYEDELLVEPELKKHFIFLGKIVIKQCPFLYQQVDYMFLPTLLECFSASYAEAMKMETPILTSNLNFAKGICKDAAIYFDPLNANEIKNRILQLSSNKKYSDQLTKNGLKRLKDFNSSRDRAELYLKILSP